MRDDGLGDWRVSAVTTITADVPEAFPGGPSHKAGALVHRTTITRTGEGEFINFITPSPVALALSVAIKASEQAEGRRGSFTFTDCISPWGDSKGIVYQDTQKLFDYFESCMVTVMFSFQALECYCNEVISERLNGTYPLMRREGIEQVSADDLQRLASTEEKLASVLPQILSIATPKGTRLWQDFKELKRIRDTTTHLKSKDAYNRNRIDDESLFFQYFNADVKNSPRTAWSMIDYFATGKRPRWLELAKESLLTEGK